MKRSLRCSLIAAVGRPAGGYVVTLVLEGADASYRVGCRWQSACDGRWAREVVRRWWQSACDRSLGASGRLPVVRGMSPVSGSASAGVVAWAAVVASVVVAATSARLRPHHFQVKVNLLGFHENEGLLRLRVQGREVE